MILFLCKSYVIMFVKIINIKLFYFICLNKSAVILCFLLMWLFLGFELKFDFANFIFKVGAFVETTRGRINLFDTATADFQLTDART